MAQFTVSGHHYKSRKMDAFKQLHVARRIGPLFGGLGDAYKKYLESGNNPMVIVEPVAVALAAIPDADVDYVINSCLDVCERGQGDPVKVWANVRGSTGLMFEDIELAEMIQICWYVVQENLSRFIGALPAELKGKLAPGQT